MSTSATTVPVSTLHSACPRVVVLSLASDFGCQVQITNFPELLDTLGTIDLSYWQLVTSEAMPDSYDVAVIEGAVTLAEHVELLKKVRATARAVIAVGACAVTGGIPGLLNTGDKKEAAHTVYGEAARDSAPGAQSPCPVSHVIDVDYAIPGCPLDPQEFSRVVQSALLGVKERPCREPLCSICRIMENPCFYLRPQGSTSTPCLGLVTRTGCGAVCITRGRPCTGCRGIAEDANLESARDYIRKSNVVPVEDFDAALQLYNACSLMTDSEGEGA